LVISAASRFAHQRAVLPFLPSPYHRALVVNRLPAPYYQPFDQARTLLRGAARRRLASSRRETVGVGSLSAGSKIVWGVALLTAASNLGLM